jgi:hypothetical protein
LAASNDAECHTCVCQQHICRVARAHWQQHKRFWGQRRCPPSRCQAGWFQTLSHLAHQPNRQSFVFACPASSTCDLC